MVDFHTSSGLLYFNSNVCGHTREHILAKYLRLSGCLQTWTEESFGTWGLASERTIPTLPLEEPFRSVINTDRGASDQWSQHTSCRESEMLSLQPTVHARVVKSTGYVRHDTGSQLPGVFSGLDRRSHCACNPWVGLNWTGLWLRGSTATLPHTAPITVLL